MYQWFVKRNESVDGPFSTYELISLSYSSKIEPNDGIATSKTGPWETAIELPCLKFPKFKKKRKENLNTPTLKLEPTFKRSGFRSYMSGSSSTAASNKDLDELKSDKIAQDSIPTGKTSPPPFPKPHSNDKRFAAAVADVPVENLDSRYNGFYRSSDQKMLAGVGGGIAHKFGIPLAAVRVLLFFFPLFGVPFYIAALFFPKLPTKGVPRFGKSQVSYAKNGAIACFIVGAIVVVNAFIFDTSVSTGTGIRVHNIGLMNEQRNMMLFGIGLLVIGGVLLAVHLNKDKSSETCW